MTTPPNIEGNCPDEVDGTSKWDKFGNNCYWTSGETSHSFDDAQVPCLYQNISKSIIIRNMALYTMILPSCP